MLEPTVARNVHKRGGGFSVVLLALVCLSGGATAPEVASAQLDLSRALTRAERALLDEGELVTRPVTEQRGRLRLIGGTSYQVIDRAPETVWRALRGDSADYRHMLPAVHRATERRRSPGFRVIHFDHRVGIVRVGYALRFQFDDSQHVVMFQLDESESHDIRAAWGFFRVRRWHDGRALVSFGSLVDIGSGLMSGAVMPTVHEWVLKIPLTMKWHMDQRGDQYVDEEDDE